MQSTYYRSNGNSFDRKFQFFFNLTDGCDNTQISIVALIKGTITSHLLNFSLTITLHFYKTAEDKYCKQSLHLLVVTLFNKRGAKSTRNTTKNPE